MQTVESTRNVLRKTAFCVLAVMLFASAAHGFGGMHDATWFPGTLLTIYEVAEGEANPGAVCGNSACETGEYCYSCALDCGACPNAPPADGGSAGGNSGGGTGGGSPGGSGGTGSEGYKAITRNLAIEPLEAGVLGTISIQIAHGLQASQSFAVTLIISSGENIVFRAEEQTPAIQSGRAFNLVFAEKWKPVPGEYTATTALYSKDKSTKLDERKKSISIPEAGQPTISEDAISPEETENGQPQPLPEGEQAPPEPADGKENELENPGKPAQQVDFTRLIVFAAAAGLAFGGTLIFVFKLFRGKGQGGQGANKAFPPAQEKNPGTGIGNAPGSDDIQERLDEIKETLRKQG